MIATTDQPAARPTSERRIETNSSNVIYGHAPWRTNSPPTTPLLDPVDGDRPAPLCDGGDKAAYTRNTIIRCDTTLLSKSRFAVTTMAIPVVALAQAEAEGCDGLACKDEYTGMAFTGCNVVAKHDQPRRCSIRRVATSQRHYVEAIKLHTRHTITRCDKKKLLKFVACNHHSGHT